MKSFLLLILSFLSIAIQAQNGKILSSTIVQASASAENDVELCNVFYESDGLKINAYLAVPTAPGKYPVIIFNRGGNRDMGSLNDKSANFLLRKMARWGYVVAASNYRGGGGSEGMEEFGGKDVNDILNLIPLLANEPKADTSKMGVYGFSRGGMMTYILLKKTCAFKAAIVGAGPTNLMADIEERPEMETGVYAQLIPNYTRNKKQELKSRSVVNWPDALCKTTPLMIMHGSADWRVSPKSSLDLVDQLYALKHPVRLLLLEGAQHGLNEFRDETNENVRMFFDHYLKEGAPLPDMEPHGK